MQSYLNVLLLCKQNKNIFFSENIPKSYKDWVTYILCLGQCVVHIKNVYFRKEQVFYNGPSNPLLHPPEQYMTNLFVC